jgi:hypothetical protein
MAPEAPSHPVRRTLLVGLAVLALLFLAGVGWFLTRRITPGVFVIRVVPAGGGPGAYGLSLLGPGGGKLGDWRFQDVPSPAVLQAMGKKVPWTAVATNASQRQPCLTLESAPFVPETALAPVERFALSQCCPGVTDVARCSIRRVVLGR